jgi:hypothetical protein
MFQDTGQFDKYKLPNPVFDPDLAPPVVEEFLEIFLNLLLCPGLTLSSYSISSNLT